MTSDEITKITARVDILLEAADGRARDAIERAMVIAVTAERERWLAAARALLEAMPKCSFCGKIATRAHARGGARYCDDHGVNVREYPRAAPVRALQAMVDEKESGK